VDVPTDRHLRALTHHPQWWVFVRRGRTRRHPTVQPLRRVQDAPVTPGRLPFSSWSIRAPSRPHASPKRRF
jgi:hypothetical protein